MTKETQLSRSLRAILAMGLVGAIAAPAFAQDEETTTLDEQTILPLVLRQSWQRDIPVFSSTYAHVKKGVLFVLYPNNRAMGKSLAAMALRPADARKGLALLRDVSVAVNLRTASHLGLNISSEQQRSFEAVFP